jgi:hypothetical protein
MSRQLFGCWTGRGARRVTQRQADDLDADRARRPPERELRWLGHFVIPGLVDGEHSRRIESLAEGRSRFIQTERFTGLLVRPLKGTLGKIELGFEQMNASLKARVEAAASAHPVT